MDPCYFLRIIIGNLAIKFPTDATAATACYCKITLMGFCHQSAAVPVLSSDSNRHPETYIAACFNLTRSDIHNHLVLYVDVYAAARWIFGLGRKLIGRVRVPLDLTAAPAVDGGKGSNRVLHNGWVSVGEKQRKGLNPEMHLSVEARPDPRFMFAFQGEPECSPQIFQVQGNIRQPVFTCKFSFIRHSADWNLRSSSTILSEPSTSKSWLSSLKDKVDKDKHQPKVKERKGWSITIHDLSGSPVAAASMVTPFVPSMGSDRVSRSNPGAWLILRPWDGTWKPWGRLEAWRDRARSGPDGLGHRFELLLDAGASTAMGPAGITLAQGTIPARSGGKFSIDITTGSPSSSFDFGSWFGSGSGSGSGSASSSGSEVGCGLGTGWSPRFMYRGFVMSSTVGVEGKCSEPVVEVGAQHVSCTEDAAVFVALAAAMDLSMDACRPFSHKLRKELRH